MGDDGRPVDGPAVYRRDGVVEGDPGWHLTEGERAAVSEALWAVVAEGLDRSTQVLAERMGVSGAPLHGHWVGDHSGCAVSASCRAESGQVVEVPDAVES